MVVLDLYTVERATIQNVRESGIPTLRSARKQREYFFPCKRQKYIIIYIAPLVGTAFER